jgi:hypothetical protein
MIDHMEKFGKIEQIQQSHVYRRRTRRKKDKLVTAILFTALYFNNK